MKNNLTQIKVISIFLFITFILQPINVFATSATNDAVSDQQHYLGDVINAGENSGFIEQNAITDDDVHYGWKLGNFIVSDFTRVITTDEANPIFLKNVGDKVTLSFSLLEDITNLNGNENLSIAYDEKGYDEYFGIEETVFGTGTLIVRYTDYQNYKNEPTIHTDYLTSVSVGNNIQVELLEEGDYEVALNYTIKSDPRNVFGLSIFPTYTDYRIFFKFSVRNGNAMVYPFDVSTGEELINTSMTENGFYLDLAKSRYLDIDVKKEILQEGSSGLTEDVRFNKPAKDGEEYTDEGIYTLTVHNRYTGQDTTKTIYVGENDILRAYITTGLEISDIQAQVANGAIINEDGTITSPVVEEVDPTPIPPTPTPETTPEIVTSSTNTQTSETIEVTGVSLPLSSQHIIIIAVAIITLIVIILLSTKRKNKKHNEE